MRRHGLAFDAGVAMFDTLYVVVVQIPILNECRSIRADWNANVCVSLPA